MGKCIIMNPADNVATVLQKVSPGDVLDILDTDMKKTGTVASSSEMPFGHKICLTPLQTGSAVVKCGEVVGKTTAAVGKGGYVHIHNVISLLSSKGNA
jgi:hypothetical protein